MDNSIIWNGKILQSGEFSLLPTNDWIRYAPGFFESIKTAGGHIYFWDDHYMRMQRGAHYWNVELPASERLKDELCELIRAVGNKAGKLRIQFGVNVKEGGLDYLAVVEDVEGSGRRYELNNEGWMAGIYKEHFKLANQDSDHKSNRRDIYLLAQQWKNIRSYDEALIINQSGKIADATFTNIFWLEDGRWYTPPLHSSCVPGVMRKFILGKQDEWEIQIAETDVFPERLVQAEEIFLTNVIRGIRWVELLYNNDTEYRMGKEVVTEVFNKLKSWEIERYPDVVG